MNNRNGDWSMSDNLRADRSRAEAVKVSDTFNLSVILFALAFLSWVWLGLSSSLRLLCVWADDGFANYSTPLGSICMGAVHHGFRFAAPAAILIQALRAFVELFCLMGLSPRWAYAST